MLAREPGHRAARRRLYLGAQRYIRLASRDIGKNELESARTRLSLATVIDPAHPELAAAQRAYRNQLESREPAEPARGGTDGLADMRLKLLLSTADTARKRYFSDPSNHRAAEEARSNYQNALNTAPGNPQVRAGLNDLGARLLKAGHAAASSRQFDEANWCLEQAQQVIPGDPGINLLTAAIINEQEPGENASENGSR